MVVPVTAVRVIDRNRSTFGASFTRRLDELDRLVTVASVKAADEAQRVSKSRAKAVRPPSAPRPGRREAPGALGRAINWRAMQGQVVLDVDRLDKAVPWWRVQEIGTGNSAVMKRGNGVAGKSGRPSKASINAKGSPHVRVKSQKGRPIPVGLGFASGLGGQYTPFSSKVRNQQLHLLADMKGVPYGPQERWSRVRIGREIPAKNFIQQGAREGFRDYRQDVVAAARATLSKRKSP